MTEFFFELPKTGKNVIFLTQKDI